MGQMRGTATASARIVRHQACTRVAPLILAACLLIHGTCHAQEAEIVSISGRGEYREPPTAEWRAAAVKQVLKAGWFVRTLENSQIGLLFTDRTQIRLKQNSQLQIKPAQETAQWSSTA